MSFVKDAFELIDINDNKGRVVCMLALLAVWWIGATAVQMEYGLAFAPRSGLTVVVDEAQKLPPMLQSRPEGTLYTVRTVQRGIEEYTVVVRAAAGPGALNRPLTFLIYPALVTIAIAVFSVAVVLKIWVVGAPSGLVKVFDGLFYAFLLLAFLAAIFQFDLIKEVLF